jgi:hypothetical protein
VISHLSPEDRKLEVEIKSEVTQDRPGSKIPH